MSKSSFILLPMGRNESTRVALDLAKRAAARLGATVVILHVGERPVNPETLRSHLGLSHQDIQLCTLEFAEGFDIAAEIAAVAQRIDASLVVLHSGRTGGQVSDITLKVIGRICCPALVARPDLDLGTDAEHRWLRRILVPLDSSPSSAQAVHRAADLARREDASLEILHIASPRDVPSYEPGSLPVGLYMDHPHYDLRSWSREFMQRFFSIAVGKHDEFTPRLHLSSGDPAEEIIRYAEQTHSDLIVLAWQGSIDEGRALVVRELLARANCQLLFLVIGRTAKPRPGDFSKTATA